MYNRRILCTFSFALSTDTMVIEVHPDIPMTQWPWIWTRVIQQSVADPKTCFASLSNDPAKSWRGVGFYRSRTSGLGAKSSQNWIVHGVVSLFHCTGMFAVDENLDAWFQYNSFHFFAISSRGFPGFVISPPDIHFNVVFVDLAAGVDPDASVRPPLLFFLSSFDTIPIKAIFCERTPVSFVIRTFLWSAAFFRQFCGSR